MTLFQISEYSRIDFRKIFWKIPKMENLERLKENLTALLGEENFEQFQDFFRVKSIGRDLSLALVTLLISPKYQNFLDAFSYFKIDVDFSPKSFI